MFVLLLLFPVFFICSCSSDRTGIWDEYEISATNERSYIDNFRDVDFTAKFTRPDGSSFVKAGFFAGDNVWKVRVMPDLKGTWEYEAAFSDGSGQRKSGRFECEASDVPGLISSDQKNPAWFGFKGGKHILIRSFHCGDRFFAANWSDSARTAFLDWLAENKYNTISVASHYLNRNSESRGRGWETPGLWDEENSCPDPAGYDRMEKILDDLAQRKIIVFPFAGFFGQSAAWPKDSLDQLLYINYTLSRLDSYWNVLYNVAGPEPLYVKLFSKDKLESLGKLISAADNNQHLLTVHNQKSKNPFRESPWASFQCLQGPTTTNTDTLYNGLLRGRNPNQPLYAQEVLWYGNIYQQNYSDEQLRKNAFTIMMSAGALNFGDNAGTSSTGFTGTLNLNDRHQDKHEIIKRVWDFFESIPWYLMSPSPERTDNAYCLNHGDSLYLYYSPEGKAFRFNPGGKSYEGEWIKGSDPAVRMPVGNLKDSILKPPTSEDWLIYLKQQ
ncbi:MAG TPA: DUF5060 domain-containing protein [Bacteroidales bacterium]|nr:DUF5060 domain-containing protein [Bacteroidales bacterium]